MPVEYVITWVTSGEDYTLKLHKTYPREGVTGRTIDVSNTTDDWTYAHEFGHCVGLPDEYGYKPGPDETVKYIKADGTLDSAIIAPYNGKDPSLADATIMAASKNTVVLPRHFWNVAIEVQELLRKNIRQTITCDVK